MKLNDKSVASFAVCSSPIDKEGYLSKRGDARQGFNRRWFVLKGNLLFYFEKKQDKEPQGVIVLEACSVQASTQAHYAFEISFDGVGTRTYVIQADNDEDMQAWMKSISHASYEYLRTIVNELQRRVNDITSTSKGKQPSDMSLLHVGPPKAHPIGASPRGSGLLMEGATYSSLSARVSATPQSQKVKIQNGILVDIEEEEAPPVPPKVKSRTLFANKGEPHPSDSPPSDDSPKLASKMHQMRTLPPHSSPVAPISAYVHGKPLSPTGTFDRTPVLEPLLVPASPTSHSHDDTTVNYSPMSVPYQPQNQRGSPKLGKVSQARSGPDLSSAVLDTGSSHPPRHLASPLKPTNKSIFEMHEEFTKAMKGLNSERTSHS